MFSSKLDIRLEISVVSTCVHLNKMNVHMKNCKIKNQPVHWFRLTELNKTIATKLQNIGDEIVLLSFYTQYF